MPEVRWRLRASKVFAGGEGCKLSWSAQDIDQGRLAKLARLAAWLLIRKAAAF